jgi:hypothetical protein
MVSIQPQSDLLNVALGRTSNLGSTMSVKHLVLFSGGIGSWACAKRVAERHGTDGMVLLFADTKVEDADLYRFVREAAEDVGAPLVTIADGRTPWEVFRDVRFIGNSKADPCSEVLKRNVLDKWRDQNCDKATTTCYVGLDWTEGHRFNGRGDKLGLRVLMAQEGWRYEAPLCERPLISKQQMLTNCECAGIAAPRLYKLGFPHNNCSGACVKAGHAQWAHLLKVLPSVYEFNERMELETMAITGSKWGILTDRRGGGKKRPMTLRQFRFRIENEGYTPREMADFEWGGCGCAIETGVTL